MRSFLGVIYDVREQTAPPETHYNLLHMEQSRHWNGAFHRVFHGIFFVNWPSIECAMLSHYGSPP